MRRTSAILALAVAALGIRAGSATAHSCGIPTRFDPDKPGAVTIGVAAEARPVTSVDIHIPPGFRIDRVLPATGWTGGHDGSVLHFTGGPIAEFTCSYFTAIGQPEKKGVYYFTITTHAPDGTVQQYASHDPRDLYPAQIVIAGVDPDLISDPGGGSSGPPWPLIIGGVVVLGVGGFVMWRRRR